MSMTPEQFKKWRDEQKTAGKFVLRAKPGFVRNPLLSYPRNNFCLCGSYRKWKKCCLPDQPLFIAKEDLAEHQMVLDGIEVPMAPEAARA